MAKLDPAQIFYIQHFADKKSPDELATDTGADVRTVKAALRRMKAEADKAAPIKQAVESTAGANTQSASEAELVGKQLPHPVGFDPHGESKGVVSMTDARSKADNEAGGIAKRRPFLDRYGNCVHVFDPSKPTR